MRPGQLPESTKKLKVSDPGQQGRHLESLWAYLDQGGFS